MKRLQEILSRVVEEDSSDLSDNDIGLINWFVENPNPDDKAVHAQADKIGMDVHKFESNIYKMATIGAYLLKADSQHGKLSDYDKEQVRMGTEVEMEHLPKEGDDGIKRKIAQIILKPHLQEMDDYYSRLKKMEGEKVEWVDTDSNEPANKVLDNLSNKIKDADEGAWPLLSEPN